MSKITIVPGVSDDIAGIEILYERIHDVLETDMNYTRWIRGIYPTKLDAEQGIAAGSLFVAKLDGLIVGSHILNQKADDAYKTAGWLVPLDDDSSFYVIHTFVVHPDYRQYGIGQQLLNFAFEYAQKTNIKSLRLDVHDNNTPAITLYEKMGYTYISTVHLDIKEREEDWYRLYERVVPLRKEKRVID